MVGMRIQVYNGNRFFTLLVDADMLGHYVGEFAPTRKKLVAKKKNK
jgi:small subunit ribosomal protein S19